MKRALLFLPLLGLAPLGYFLGPYLQGSGVLPCGSGFIIGGASMFLLPFAVSALFLTIGKVVWPIRVSLFICALLVQAALLLTAVPPAAVSEMTGIALRLSREYPPDQMRNCATQLNQKRRDGTLKQKDRGPSFLMSEHAMSVDDSELPVSLRGRFSHVFIQQDPATGGEQVFFSLGERDGIVCDNRKRVKELFVCSMAEGVHAYRYQRL